MTDLLVLAGRAQLRSYAEEDDGLSFFACSATSEYDVPWFDSVSELLQFVNLIRDHFAETA